MVNIREFTPEDLPALQKAIDLDLFHTGEWKVEYFQIVHVLTKVIEDSKGPIAFVLYTDTEINSKSLLRISCVWADSDDQQRNARAIIHGIHDAVEISRAKNLEGIVIQTSYSKLADFLTRVIKMERCGDEYLLYRGQ